MNQESNKEKVIQAAVKLFSQQGYHETTVLEIAEEAEVAKGTVYWYFESKKELFFGIILSGMEDINNQILKEIDKQEKSAVAKLEDIIKLFLRHFKNQKNIAKMMQENSVSPQGNFYAEIHKLRQKAVNNIAQVIEEGIENNEFRVSIDSQEVTNFILGSIIGSYNPHVYELNDTDIEQKVDFLLKIILNGISTK